MPEEKIENEELSTEEQEKEVREGFSSGFAKVMGDDPNAQPTPPEGDKGPEDEVIAEDVEEIDDAAQAQADADAAEERKQRELDNLPKRLQRMEGRMGEVLAKLNGLATSEKAAERQAPTSAQVDAALKDPLKMKALESEYEDFAPMVQEIKALREDLSKVASSQVDLDAVADHVSAKLHREDQSARYDQSLDEAHPEWQDQINSEEFLGFAVDGGPTLDAYKASIRLRSDPEKHAQVLDAWQRDYPKWWDERGNLLYSNDVQDSISILDQFTGKGKKKPDPVTREKERRQRRLSGARTPDSQGGVPTAGRTEQESFKRGFNKVIKSSLVG